ncbi:hypothetical protein B9T11_07800 [Wohlfahrtiimonas chitiniclastica]|uniref:dsDNA nuclease domain-containing protein n=1 Tax=Wohlfahrtiimonas chitiniclastica TaxID=400946 RepID=UPI000B999340|nr:dsDNA nuclease domain-containing protein [Wohlfahrtiimonas chitiniclastica]OYQ79131.1 hypothetical protein B9T11_07800 [Wohlfahrtiimonas chitiniclastica]
MSIKYDDGGANAIRGFNYQKAVIAYVAICNWNEKDFYIIPENKEDIEVYKQGKIAYIQVKSSSLSINKLKASSKDNGLSIIAKLIQKEGDGKFKIATTNTFSKTDFKKLIEDQGDFCEHGIYKLSEDQKTLIKEELKKGGAFTDEFIESRIEQVYIMISMFSNDQMNATTSLLGLMSQKGCKVDGAMGSTSLNELFSQIEASSEINHKHLDDPAINKKIIKSEDLRTIFHAVVNDNHIRGLRQVFLDDCAFNPSDHSLISRYFLSIKVKYRYELYSIKHKINDQLNSSLADLNSFFDPNSDFKLLIDNLYQNVASTEMETAVNYSLVLHALAEIAVERGYG